MSNWICEKCGANYIDVSHQEPSVLKQELEIRKLKELLKDCYKMLAQYQVENSEPSIDENIELLTKIDNAIGEKK